MEGSIVLPSIQFHTHPSRRPRCHHGGSRCDYSRTVLPSTWSEPDTLFVAVGASDCVETHRPGRERGRYQGEEPSRRVVAARVRNGRGTRPARVASVRLALDLGPTA